MTDRDLMQRALDALENSVDLVREDAYQAEKLYGNYPTRQNKVKGLKVLADDHEKAIASLRERLAQPEQRKPLTDAQAKTIAYVGPVYAPDGVVTRSALAYRQELEQHRMDAIRRTEAAHNIKEQP
jgi:hypothetical protein